MAYMRHRVAQHLATSAGSGAASLTCSVALWRINISETNGGSAIGYLRDAQHRLPAARGASGRRK